MFLFMALKLYCCTTENVTYLIMALKMYCCTTGNKHEILRDSSISLTWLGKQAMDDDRCDYCA